MSVMVAVARLSFVVGELRRNVQVRVRAAVTLAENSPLVPCVIRAKRSLLGRMVKMTPSIACAIIDRRCEIR